MSRFYRDLQELPIRALADTWAPEFGEKPETLAAALLRDAFRGLFDRVDRDRTSGSARSGVLFAPENEAPQPTDGAELCRVREALESNSAALKGGAVWSQLVSRTWLRSSAAWDFAKRWQLRPPSYWQPRGALYEAAAKACRDGQLMADFVPRGWMRLADVVERAGQLLYPDSWHQDDAELARYYGLIVIDALSRDLQSAGDGVSWLDLAEAERERLRRELWARFFGKSEYKGKYDRACEASERYREIIGRLRQLLYTEALAAYVMIKGQGLSRVPGGFWTGGDAARYFAPGMIYEIGAGGGELFVCDAELETALAKLVPDDGRTRPTIATERRFEAWLRKQLADGLAPLPKGQLWKIARTEFPALSLRAYDRVRAEILPPEWRRPGPKPRSKQGRTQRGTSSSARRCRT